MSWGVPVPGDENHVMYVWFDALVNYISTLGWPENTENFEKFWKNGTPVQYCGNDNLRQQAAMWQAMLMAAGLPNASQVVVDGFITGEGGVKMSKSLGNTVNPYDLVSEYGTDAVRYFLLAELSSFEDSPFTMERFKAAYNAKLANGLGNLASRVMKMAETNLESPPDISGIISYPEYFEFINNYEINKAVNIIWQQITALDQIIQTELPFKIIKTDIIKGRKIITDLVRELHRISLMLEPILPITSLKIKELIVTNTAPTTPLFLRKD
jgi:methionyl-tRNA synthetase